MAKINTGIEIDDSASLTGAFTKLKLARKNLNILKEEIGRINQPERDVILWKKHPRKPTVLRAQLPKRTDDISAQVGAFAVALKSALDQAVHATWRKDTGKPVPEKKGQFPICEKPQDFKSCAARDIAGLSKEHQELVERVQPYNRHSQLRRLPLFANTDKHRNLVEITTTGEATWEYVQKLRMPRDPSLDTTNDPHYASFLPIDRSVYAHRTGEVTSRMSGEVIFRDDNQRVADWLDVVYAEVSFILDQFKPIFD